LSGSTPTANLLTGLNLDEIYRRTDSQGARDFLTDALGSTLALSDSLAQIKTQYTYAPYGATTSGGEPSSNPFQYTGRENDGTGLYYYRARYYDPVRARFISEDPIGFVGGINLATYAGGNPVLHTDPDGLAPNMRPYGSGNSSQRRYDRRHSPSRPGMPSGGDSASEAAGYYNDEGEYVCLRWSCPGNPNQCSKDDTRSHNDFLPAATDPANPPTGCTCDERRFSPKNVPGTKGLEDYVDAATRGYKRFGR
ncbi:MAG: RHS repeat-associated core domain-containing protein, partial [Gallionellaceae bacterium]|nr:RHS repeat-associated core domain-containing protein [Gallionellaceae bacterium]